MDAARQPVTSTDERLRTAGLRATRPRKLVLELLDGLPGHHSADDIADGLAARATPLPRASVYNVLDALSTGGLIMVADAGPGRTLFEASGRWHHHFVCRSCGEVRDVECVGDAKPCLHAEIDADVDEAQVIFRGRCRGCTGSPR